MVLPGEPEGELFNGAYNTFYESMARKADEPNRISQTARGLSVGKAYSLQFVTGDLRDITGKKNNPRRYGIEAELKGGEPIAERSFVHIDRRKAQAQGVDFSAINTALSTAYGSAVINEFPNAGRLQRVVVQADAQARARPEDILRLHVPNAGGQQVGTFASRHELYGRTFNFTIRKNF